MNVIEIFSELSTHMIQGMMVHESLMNSYRYLALPGYAKCHEYHYMEETVGHVRLLEFATNRYGALIPPGQPHDPEIIPADWYLLKSWAIPIMDQKPKAVASAINTWINWERKTLSLYEECYSELLSMNETDAANFVNKYINDVSSELVYAQNERLAKESMDYDIPSIIEEQKAYEKRFAKKLRKLKGV